MSPRKRDMMSILEEWIPDMEQGISSRAASLLDFAAKKLPGQPVPWTIVTKRVLGGARMPSPDSKNVIDMRHLASSIRVVLERNFHRGLENVAGLGVRATIDSDDYAQTQLVRRAKRHESSYRRLVEGRQLVDTKTMKNKGLKNWVEGLSPLFSAHTDRLSKLLLPPAEQDKKKKDEP